MPSDKDHATAIGNMHKTSAKYVCLSASISPELCCFMIVMEAISREFRVALPWELLYADDLAVIAETEDVLRKDDDDWVKKCMEYEVEGSRPRGRPKRTWEEVVREDCQARKLNKEDAVDRCKWRKVIKEVR